MTYRDNADALAARHATLTAELAHKQRELDEVTAMLADARRADQAATYFERAPDLRRRQKHHLAAAGLIVALLCGGGLGAAVSSAKHSHRVQAAELETRLVQIRSTQAAREATQRLRAEIEALRALGGPLAEARLGKVARAPRPSLAGEHER
jgi:hypothetical protein